MNAITSALRVTIPLTLLAACSILPSRPPAPAMYDLGYPESNGARLATGVAVLVGTVTEPDWLSNTDIHYRLLYDDPRQLRSYADSRWADTPGAMLREKIEVTLVNTQTNASSKGVRYTIDLRVLTFEQEFSNPSSAVDDLQVLAVVHRSSDGDVVARRIFIYRQDTTPNARGAADQLANMSNELSSELSSWIKSVAPTD